MSFSTLLIKSPNDWFTVANSLIALTQNVATDVHFVDSIEKLCDDSSIVDVVVMQLHGQADYALEIYWKGMANLADDTVGMHLAFSIGSAVIVSNNDPNPFLWLLLQPNGMIEEIEMDLDQLDLHSIVAYKLV
jgi:hypothetical protein